MQLKSFFKQNQEIILVSVLILIAICLRWLLIRDNNIYFWYDQARDAHYARSIIENRDLKIQGPSASGTQDTVYHGVLYYYFIAPFYTLGGGNPFAPTLALIVWNSLAIIPLYLLTKEMTQSKIAAVFTCLLFAFSFENTAVASWLSNPSLGILPITVFYLALWKVFVKNNKKYIPVLALSFGASIQSAIWLIYLAAPLMIFYLAAIFGIKELKLKLRSYAIFAGFFLVSISTMIAAQYRLWRVGIFSPDIVLTDVERSSINISQLAQRTAFLFSDKWVNSIVPNYYWPGLIAAILLLAWLLLCKVSKKKKLLILSILLAPLALILVSPRFTYHLLLNTEVGFYLMAGLLVAKVSNSKLKLTLIGLSALVFIGANTQALYSLRSSIESDLYIQKGANLKNQLQLIETSYQLAGGDNFSISSYGNPLYYSITWSYLYDWWAESSQINKPAYFGAGQAGKVGEGLLDEVNQPKDTHFAIIEPPFDASPVFKEMFLDEQDNYTTVIKKYEFGTIQMEHRSLD